MAKKVAILGSTGSIGKNALRVIEALNTKEQSFEIAALSAHNNVELLAQQVRRWMPKFAAITNTQKYNKLKELTANCDVQILAGPESLIEISQLEEVDIVLSAVVGLSRSAASFGSGEKRKEACYCQ